MMYTFGDDSSPACPNQKHRRSRGFLPRQKSNNPAASIRNGAASSQNIHGRLANSNSQGDKNYSSATARANQPQATYYSAEGWGNTPINSSNNNNDETGSLNYSTSSSAQSTESSSNSSSFAKILKQIDSDIDLKDYSEPEIKELMPKQSKVANNHARLGQAQYSKMRRIGMEMTSSAPPPAAVAGWIQRREQQQQQQREKQYQYQTQRKARMEMQQHAGKQQHQNYSSTTARANQSQATYYSAEGRGNTPISSSNNNNDETESLNYSTSSSAQSAESSSNGFSFAEILKHIDLKDYSEPEIKGLMAKQSKAANNHVRLGQAQYSKMRGMGMEMPSSAPPPAAVAGWIQNREQQQQQQQQEKQYQHQIQQEAQMEMKQAQQHARKQQHQYNNNNHMSSRLRQQQYASSGHVEWSYSRDGSEGEINGVNCSEQEENVSETIAGKRDGDNKVNRLANITINTVRPQAAHSPGNNVFRGRDPLGQQRYPHRSRSDSPASRGRAAAHVASSHVTPPPNARGKRTSAAPPGSARFISLTSSRQSESSSDGSINTAGPISPPKLRRRALLEAPAREEQPCVKGAAEGWLQEGGQSGGDWVVFEKGAFW